MKNNILILLVLCVMSCGDKQKKESTTIQPTSQIKEYPKLESVFKINLNMVIPNDDTIEVYYLDFDDISFSYKTKVSKKVKGSPKAQDIEILLPKDIFPYNLRLDFGDNKSEEDLILNAVSMSYDDFELALTAEEFHSFFMPNTYANFTKETGVIERKIIDGKYDPYFRAREVFKKKLQLEVR